MAVSVNRPVRLSAVAALSVVGLLLVGCSGDAGGDGATSAASEASASPSASETTGGGSGSPSASPSASAFGSYEPATSEGPAKNVPVPEMPEAVKEPTEAGVEAAVEYWWKSMFYLRQTGDIAPFERVSDEGCALCEDQIVRWSDIYQQGGWAVTDLADVEVNFTKMDPDSAGATTSFLVSEAPGELFRPDGERVEESSGEGTDDQPWAASMVFDEEQGNWRVESLEPQGIEG